MNQEIENFINDWKKIRGKTYEFFEKVSQDKMTWSPHKLLGTFGMQLRHIGKSQEAYIKGIKNGKIDFSDKSFDSELEKNKVKAIKYLRRLDKELIELLKEINNPDKEIIFVDGVYGEHKVSLKEVLHYLIEHESYHQGIFTCYGRLAGLEKFIFM